MYVFLAILSIPLLVFGVLQSDSVQNYIVQKVSKQLSEYLETKVLIKDFEILSYDKYILKEILIADQQNDTILFSKNTEINLNYIDFDKQIVHLKSVKFDNLCSKLIIANDGKLNIQFIIDKLRTEKTDSNSVNWSVLAKEIETENSFFNFRRQGFEAQHFGVNYHNIALHKFAFAMKNFAFQGDSINFDVEEFSGIEKSGFKITKIESTVKIKSNQIYCETFDLNTTQSDINLRELSLDFESFGDWNDYINKVKMTFTMDSSEVFSSDLAYFAPYLKDFNQKVIAKGKVKGFVSDFRVRDFTLWFGNNTKLTGKVDITGLPNIDQTYILADIKKLNTSIQDIEKIKIQPFSGNNFIEIPQQLRDLGNVQYSGDFTGFIGDFVAHGTLKTNSGEVYTDISLKEDVAKNSFQMNGKLKSTKFDIGKMLKQSDILGTISLNLNVNGTTDKIGNVEAKIDGKVEQIEFNNYNYNNIDVNGNFANKLFDGELHIDDSNIKMDFLGKVNFTENLPIYDFEANVEHVKLQKLHLLKNDSISEFSGLITANLIGKNIDDIYGNLNIDNVTYQNKNGKLNSKNINFTATNDSIKSLNLKSDLANVDLFGEFQLSTLPQAFSNLLNKYFSLNIFPKTENQKIAKNNFKFTIEVNDINKYLKVFSPDLQVKTMKANGNFNSIDNSINLSGNISELIFNGDSARDLQFFTKNRDSILTLYLESKAIRYKSIFVQNVVANAEFLQDTIFTNFHWFNESEKRNSGDINATIFVKNNDIKNPKLEFYINPSNLFLSDIYWDIDESKISYDTSKISIEKFKFYNGNQQFELSGAISKNINDTLLAEFKNIDIKKLLESNNKSEFNFAGIVNGKAKISDIYDKMYFDADLKIDTLVFNNEVLGTFFVSSKWNKNAQGIYLNSYANRGQIKTLDVSGFYFPSTQTLDLNANLNKLKLDLIEPYFKDYVSKVKGIATGNLAITGKIKNPEIVGDLKLQKSTFLINYLKTQYNFTSVAHFKKHSIELENAEIFDIDGHKAIVSGNLKYDFSKNIFYDATVKFDNLMCLNTSEKDNDLFYGKAYATGVINIGGTQKNVNINISAKSEKNTKFFIPLSSSENIGENNFITFVDKKNPTLAVNKDYKVDLSGIKMNFDLEVTPDAEVQIIFDSKTGDIIKANGNGNFNMEINTIGDFNMYGDYVIEKGDYLFTLENVINKRFDIEKGSVLKWNGNPYEAQVDINALYSVKTSLTNLVGVSDTSDVYKRRVPVNCYLQMKNNLMNPDIKFKIDIPSADDKVSGIIAGKSDDDINKQIISLLILNTFTSQETGGLATAEVAMGTTSSELLSNQLSHWLSQINKDLDIGVNYRPGTELSSDEVELALSTQILNDRVSINGNVGVGGSNPTSTNSSSVVGDVSVEVKINKSGKLKVKGFTRTDETITYETYNRQGVGIFYREDFNKLSDLFHKYFYRREQDQED